MSIEFVDCNCMMGRWKMNVGKCFNGAGDLINCMDKAGIQKTLVFSSFAKYSEIQTGNSILVESIQGHDRLIPCAVAMPNHSGEFQSPVEFCRYLAEHNIRAIRIFPNFHGVSLYTWLWKNLFYELERFKIPVFIDLTLERWSDEINWGQIYDLCESFPELPLIMVKMGVKADRYIYSLFEKFKNLYIETSYYIVNNGLEKITERFGAGRLVFGTGMPFLNPNSPIAMIMLSKIEQSDKELIAGRNLMDLLGRVDFNAL